MDERIDIILPNYNKAKYIDQCIRSLLDQSYSNWHCIVIDGYSEDGSWDIIKKYAETDKRFELYQVTRTSCLYDAWNFGLNKVNSNFFCFLTSDDLWPCNWLESAIATLNDYPNAICSVARVIEIDENGIKKRVPLNVQPGERFFKTKSSEIQIRSGILDSIAHYFLGTIYISIHAFVMRSTVLENGMKFSLDVGSVADYEWMMLMGLNGDIIYHPNVEVGWRTYVGQATDARKQDEMGAHFQKIHSRNRPIIAEKLGNAGRDFIRLSKKYDSSVLRYHYLRPCVSNIKDAPIKSIIKLLRVSFQFPRETFNDIWMLVNRKKFFIERSIAVAETVKGIIS